MIENRKHARRPGNNQAALIYPGPGEPPIMCTVADISEGGAGLTVVNTKVIPEMFELQLKSEETRRSCRIAWKQDPHKLGVQFLTQPSAVAAD